MRWATLRSEHGPPRGPAPYIRLTAKGVSGLFLLDYGSTGSSLTAKVFASSHGLLGASDLSMPGFEGGQFALQGPSFSSLPPGRLLGMIGTDFLSRMSVQFTHGSVFLSNEVCPVDKLRALGFAPINQHGFFSSEKSAIDPPSRQCSHRLCEYRRCPRLCASRHRLRRSPLPPYDRRQPSAFRSPDR